MLYESEVINVNEDSVLLFLSTGEFRISAFTNQSRVSYAVRVRESSAVEYQSDLPWSSVSNEGLVIGEIRILSV